ncbi:MAG: trehalose-phosphatase [Alphaproteobacteria bacterium]|nr:trehalose-phosphatase [Alphaproteobacteria bacterium]
MTTHGSTAKQELRRLPPPPAFSLAGAALFLDVDGTLAPIMPRPEDVGPDARRARMMKRLGAAMDGRVAVVSGRALEDLDRILENQVIAVAAIHGLTRRDAAGAVVRATPHAGLEDARLILRDLARCDPGLQFEDKELSVTLHYRRAPAAGDAVIEAAERLARSTGLVLQMGDMVVELRTPGLNKGGSVSAFLNEPPFLGAMPIFVGDDFTDEDGFIAAAQAGGFGVLVGPARETAATYGLADCDAVLSWLEGVATPLSA